MGRVRENAGVDAVGGGRARARVPSHSGQAVTVARLQIPKELSGM